MQQAATLPFVLLESGIEVLLITSRRRRRWIVPKGWPQKGQSLAQSAAREAYEEAGVVGPVQVEPLGAYSYDKDMSTGYSVLCHVFVYALAVRLHMVDWDERGDRRMRWMSLGEAARKADDRSLAKLLSELDQQDGVPLTAFLSALTNGSADVVVDPAAREVLA